MAWPRTEKVGEGTLGLGRGWRDCLSRKWASYLDLVGMDMMGFGMGVSRLCCIDYLLEISGSRVSKECDEARRYI